MRRTSAYILPDILINPSNSLSHDESGEVLYPKYAMAPEPLEIDRTIITVHQPKKPSSNHHNNSTTEPNHFIIITNLYRKCAVSIMGSGYIFQCPYCEGETEITLGVGMAYAPRHVFFGWDGDVPLLKSLVSPQVYQKAQSLMSLGGKPDAEDLGSYGHKLYYCPRCRTMHTHFYFRIIRPDDSAWSPGYRCDVCRAMLVLTPQSG